MRCPDIHRKAARRETPSSPVSRLRPLAALSHQACQEMNWNTADVGETQAPSFKMHMAMAENLVFPQMLPLFHAYAFFD